LQPTSERWSSLRSQVAGSLAAELWRGLDGISVALGVQFVTPSGFAGRWGPDLGIVQVAENGRVLGDPHGYFCASGGEYGARLDANAVQWSAAPDKEWRKLGAVVNTKRAGS